MTLPRFYCPVSCPPGATLELPEAIGHHALRVLRLKPDSAIVLFDGTGGQYRATLQVQGKRGLARIEAFEAREAELPGHLTLVQGLPAGDKMDWIIEKAVELGVAAIVPVSAQRSVLHLSGARLEKRMLHWRRVAQAACEQCGRNRLPVVNEPVSLERWLAASSGLRLLCDPAAGQALAPVLAAQAPVTALSLLVGPEGGWSDEETAAAHRAGALAVQMGPRVLRTETAGLALIAAVSATLGWL